MKSIGRRVSGVGAPAKRRKPLLTTHPASSADPRDLKPMLDAIPLFGLFKAKMGYETQRQRTLAENVANSDTPGFAPSDLKPFSAAMAVHASAVGGVSPARTSPMHLAGRAYRSGGALKPVTSPDSEARLDGNQVVLEEEMMKLSNSRGAYDTAVSLYQQSLSMLRTATRAPGR